MSLSFDDSDCSDSETDLENSTELNYNNGILSPVSVLSPAANRKEIEQQEKNNFFKWDGSYLGQVERKDIEWELKTKRGKYFKIKIDGNDITCQFKTSKTALPCIIDELKPLFGLEKLGTHYVKINTTKYILIRTKLFVDMGGIEEDYGLNELVKNKEVFDEDFIKKVQKIYIFRNILNVSSTFDRSIRVRFDENEKMYPLSFTEIKMEPDKRKPLSAVCIRRWFDKDETLYKTILSDMLNITGETSILSFRNEMDKVFSRVSTDSVAYKNSILRNIQDKLIL